MRPEAIVAPPPLREGLPPDFRMRADAHYVDLLESPRNRHNGSAADALGALAGPARTASDELAKSLSALDVSAQLLRGSASDFAKDVAADLLRAELWRATCLLQWSRVLRNEITLSRRAVPAQEIVARVLDAIEPERRLRGASISRQVTLSHGRVQVDQELVVGALSGLIMAMLGLFTRAEPRIVVAGRLDPGGDFTFSILQDTVAIPVGWLASRDGERVAGWAGEVESVACHAARRIVEQCDGRLAVTPAGRCGGIHVTIPTVS